MPAPRRIYLIDGSGYIFRAYYALPPLTRRDGTPTGAVAGFCNMLVKLLDEIEAAGGTGHLAVIFDRGKHTFRNDIYPQYKAHRPDPPKDLVPQFALIREATRAFNLPCIEQEEFEADDLIATYARLARDAGFEVIIVSSDKDLMQLIRDGVTMLDPIRARPITAKEVSERFGVAPEKVVDVQALAGDPTDNIPGVPGIGVRTAAELIATFGDLDSLLTHLDRITQPKRREALLAHAEDARLSRTLVRLREDVPVMADLEALRLAEPDAAVLMPFLEKMEFARLLHRFRERFPTFGRAAPPAAAAPPAHYQTITDTAALADVIAEARTRGVVAIAVMAEGTLEAVAVGIALALAPGRAAYVALRRHGDAMHELGTGAPAAAGSATDGALAALKPLLEDPAVLKVGHDIKAAVKLLAGVGIAVAPLDDVMLLSFILDAGRESHGVAELCQRQLGVAPPPLKDVVGSGRSAVGFAAVPLADATRYAAQVADLTGRLRGPLRQRLLVEHLVAAYETLERPLVPVLAAMERAGIRVDPDILRTLSQDFGARIAGLEAEIHGLAGHAFNIGSPKQLGEVLFDELRLEGGRRGKTGAYGTGADVLEALAAEGHALPARVLDWRQLTKLKSTYSDTLVNQINPRTGRVHTTYDQAGAATGRLASNDPNLQNIPVRTEEGRKIRRAFVAGPGMVLLSADYSQIELRLLAHMADIAGLKEAFAAGQDIHALTASQVFNVPVAGMDPAVRRSAKAINFGIIYGISPFGLARQLGIERKEAATYIAAYFERYPGIVDYMERTKALCREHGYVRTLFGRRCHLPGIRDRNPAARSFAERASINAPLQGSAADIIKRAMIRVPGALADKRLNGQMLLQVHDELILEVPEGEVEATARVLRSVMAGVAHLSVPLVVDVGTGANWGEAH